MGYLTWRVFKRIQGLKSCTVVYNGGLYIEDGDGVEL